MSSSKQTLQNPSLWVDEHGDALYRYALKHTSRPEAARDLVQETFLAAFKAKEKFKGDSTLRTWLTSILRHKIIDQFRRDARTPQSSTNSSIEEDLLGQNLSDETDWRLNPVDHLEQKQFLSTLENCLQKLPDKLRTIFILKEVEGHNRSEICNEFGISTSHVGVLLHRAREQLRSCLGKNWPE